MLVAGSSHLYVLVARGSGLYIILLLLLILLYYLYTIQNVYNNINNIIYVLYTEYILIIVYPLLKKSKILERGLATGPVTL